MLWKNLREEEFYDAIEECGKVCVIPIGCLEMHGQHLPVGTDTMITKYIVEEASKIEPVMVVPELYYGDVQGLYQWKGTITFSEKLLIKMLTELCAEIARNGFKKIMIVNTHGGNTSMLSTFVRSTMHDKKDYVVCWRDDCCYEVKHLAPAIEAGEEFPELTEEDKQYVLDFVAKGGEVGHACINETACVMKSNPETVRLDRCDAVDGLTNHKAYYLWQYFKPKFWSINHPNSYHGTAPYGANDRIGAVIMRKRIEAQVEACRALKKDDQVLVWNEEWNNRW